MAVHATLRCEGFRLRLTVLETADTPMEQRKRRGEEMWAECTVAGLGFRGNTSGFLWPDELMRFTRELEHLHDLPDNTAELRPMDGWTRFFLKFDRSGHIAVEGHLQNEPTWRMRMAFTGKCERADVDVFFRELRLAQK